MEIPTEEELKQYQRVYYDKHRIPEDMDILRKFDGLGIYIDSSYSPGNKWYEFSIALRRSQDKEDILSDAIKALRTQEIERTPEHIAAILKARFLEKDHDRTNNATRFSCLLCAKAFTSNHDLIRHRITHSDIRPHVCSLCRRRFTLKGSLRRHSDRFHAIKEHPAIIDPDRKIKRKISGKTWYQCPFKGCFRNFKTSIALDIHFTKHTKEKPIACDICEMFFISKCNLYRHTRRFHK